MVLFCPDIIKDSKLKHKLWLIVKFGLFYEFLVSKVNIKTLTVDYSKY